MSKKGKRRHINQIVVVLIVLALWGGNWFFLFFENHGVVGDMFGVVNSLFSGLAFAFLIMSVRMQNQELALQRKELKLTRKELKGQREELNRQNETFSLQQFENSFFTLVRFHLDIAARIKPKIERSDFSQDSIFHMLVDEFKNQYQGISGYSSEGERIELAYNRFYDIYQEDLGHFFRNLYQILKFINSNGGIDQKRYASLLRAQISSYEFVLLFYNGLSKYGRAKFKPLMEKYNFLENMSKELLLLPEHKSLYNLSVFGEHSQ